MSVRSIQNSAEYRVSGGVDRVPRSERHGTTSDCQNSPVQHVIETGQWLDTVLSEATDRRFPILATLRTQGITHYVMAPLIFSNRIINPISWGSNAPGWFRCYGGALIGGHKFKGFWHHHFTVNSPPRRHFENWGKGRHQIAKEFNIRFGKPFSTGILTFCIKL
jgi:hypothetical protein